MNERGRSYTVHDPIVDALRLRDPEAAVRAIQEHFEVGRKALANHVNVMQED
jgi:DNA-binding FadR family transcriptional regulator